MTESKSHHVGTLSPEMALLGLLHGGQGYGYDLHRKVVADLGQVWHLSQSQAYAILKRLEARGDISAEEIPQKKLPAAPVAEDDYAGAATFSGLAGCSQRRQHPRHPHGVCQPVVFPGAVFSGKTPPGFRPAKSGDRTHIHRLEKTLTELPKEQIHNRMSLDLRLKQLKIVLDWLDDCQKNIRRHKNNLKKRK